MHTRSPLLPEGAAVCAVCLLYVLHCACHARAQEWGTFVDVVKSDRTYEFLHPVIDALVEDAASTAAPSAAPTISLSGALSGKNAAPSFSLQVA